MSFTGHYVILSYLTEYRCINLTTSVFPSGKVVLLYFLHPAPCCCSETVSPQGGVSLASSLSNTALSMCQDVLTSGFIVIHADPVQLQVAVSMVGSCWVDAVLVTDHLPELRRNTQIST